MPLDGICCNPLQRLQGCGKFCSEVGWEVGSVDDLLGVIDRIKVLKELEAAKVGRLGKDVGNDPPEVLDTCVRRVVNGEKGESRATYVEGVKMSANVGGVTHFGGRKPFVERVGVLDR